MQMSHPFVCAPPEMNHFYSLPGEGISRLPLGGAFRLTGPEPKKRKLFREHGRNSQTNYMNVVYGCQK
jgi:hypothetical protein